MPPKSYEGAVGAYLPQPPGRIGGGGHRGSAGAVRGVCRELNRRRIRQANAGVPVDVFFAASGAVAFAGILIAQAGQLIAAADAVAIPGFRSGLDGNKSHSVRRPQFPADSSQPDHTLSTIASYVGRARRASLGMKAATNITQSPASAEWSRVRQLQHAESCR